MAVKYNVVLVAGHAIGGDSGAVGQGTTEAIENAQIVDRVKKLLLPHPTVGVDVVPHNLDYVASTNWINQRYKWDESDTIVVEVHLNAPAVASGTETLVGRGGLSYPETKRLASTIQKAVVESVKLPNRGIKEQSLYLIENCNPLACLVEVRFIGVDDNSDAADAKAATGLANGICDFFRQPRPKAPAVITTKTVTTTQVVPYKTVKTNDDTLPIGQSKVHQKGVNGVKTITWKVTLTNGKETARTQTKAVVTKEPVDELVHVGVKPLDDTSEVVKENNALLKQILALLNTLMSKITSIFK